MHAFKGLMKPESVCLDAQTTVGWGPPVRALASMLTNLSVVKSFNTNLLQGNLGDTGVVERGLDEIYLK